MGWLKAPSYLKKPLPNFEVDYIVGGVSEDSVATVNKLTLDEEDTEVETQE